jgi:hypothetical protein
MFNYKLLGTVMLVTFLWVQSVQQVMADGAPPDPLPSWKTGPVKASIINFVSAVTDATGPGYIPPAERIATFDNDGTLWSERPVYFQLLFAIDRIKALDGGGHAAGLETYLPGR